MFRFKLLLTIWKINTSYLIVVTKDFYNRLNYSNIKRIIVNVI